MGKVDTLNFIYVRRLIVSRSIANNKSIMPSRFFLRGSLEYNDIKRYIKNLLRGSNRVDFIVITYL